MKRRIALWTAAAVLSLTTVGTASAHVITVDPSANGNGQGETTTIGAGGGPAHCRAAAPSKEQSPVVSFTPPAPICD